MIDIKSLPNDPIDALTTTLTYCISNISGGQAKFGALRKQHHSISSSLIVASMVIKKSAVHLGNQELLELITRCVQFEDESTLESILKNLEIALNAVIAHQLDEHFIDQEAIELFDKAHLSNEEKNEIRSLMASARTSVDRSSTLTELQRKNVLYHISKIENELHKEKSSLQTFVAAAYDISSIFKRVGEDAKPLAEAIEKARTITEKKVEGSLAIGKDEDQKRLPKPE